MPRVLNLAEGARQHDEWREPRPPTTYAESVSGRVERAMLAGTIRRVRFGR